MNMESKTVVNLDDVFKQANWQVLKSITTYTACVYGSDGTEPGSVDIMLESATDPECDITAFRWIERDDGGTYNRGPISLDREEAEASGEEYAEENDDEPDAEELISEIVDTEYFGDADADDIRSICKAATEHSQGYLLLPAGSFCGYPIGRMWTINGYLQCDNYISLDATCHSISYAADKLLRAVVENRR